nr:hypothetical protein Iba_chr14cCG4920 [Ipomoea batatas]
MELLGDKTGENNVDLLRTCEFAHEVCWAVELLRTKKEVVVPFPPLTPRTVKVWLTGNHAKLQLLRTCKYSSGEHRQSSILGNAYTGPAFFIGSPLLVEFHIHVSSIVRSSTEKRRLFYYGPLGEASIADPKKENEVDGAVVGYFYTATTDKLEGVTGL